MLKKKKYMLTHVKMVRKTLLRTIETRERNKCQLRIQQHSWEFKVNEWSLRVSGVQGGVSEFLRGDTEDKRILVKQLKGISTEDSPEWSHIKGGEWRIWPVVKDDQIPRLGGILAKTGLHRPKDRMGATLETCSKRGLGGAYSNFGQGENMSALHWDFL